MPGLGGRMSTVIKAKISKMLDRAEDPGETLDYGYQKQVELLQNVKKGIADVVTSKKRLQMQSSKLEQQIVKLDTQARQALSQGREDLARTAKAFETDFSGPGEPPQVALARLPDSCLQWPGFDQVLARIWQNVHSIIRKVGIVLAP